MKITIELNESDLEELLEILKDHPELIDLLSEQRRYRYSSLTKEGTD